MLKSKAQVTFLALLVTAGCSPGGNEYGPTDSLSSASFASGHNLYCRACNLNGNGIYQSNKFTNMNYGLSKEIGNQGSWALLGFQNGFSGNISNGTPYVKANWGDPTWGSGGSYSYAHQQTNMQVGTVTYNGSKTYTLKSITASSSHVLTVKLQNSSNQEVDVSNNLANLTIWVSPPGHTGLGWDIKFASATSGLGDPYDNHLFHNNGNETLTGYSLTTRATNTAGSWNYYCDLGSSAGSSTQDWMIPFSDAIISDGNAQALNTGSNYLTMACRGGGLAVVADVGYEISALNMTWSKIRAAIMAKIMSPCGDGWSFTYPTVTFMFADSYSPHIQDPGSDYGITSGKNLELYWTENGAVLPPNGGGLYNQRPNGDMFDLNNATDNWCGVDYYSAVPATWSIVTRPCTSIP